MRFKGNDNLTHDGICTLIDRLSSCHPYIMYLMYDNIQLHKTRHANNSQCWCPCHETLTKWATNTLTHALAHKITTCTQHRDTPNGTNSFPKNHSTFMSH